MNRGFLRIAACTCICLLLAAAPAAAQQYDVYKNGVPDVDKPAPDQTCWINSAANVLAGGGWGTGANAQARAVGIRSDLTAHFGTVTPGWSSVAINWWLLNHGLNSGSADYDPNGTYTDVTYMDKRLTDLDYWDTGPNVIDEWEADGATLLCPGLTKPDEAMGNYDVAYFKDMDAAGNLFNNMREAGDKVGVYTFDDGNSVPYWEPDTQVHEFYLPNEEVPDMWKEVWLLIDYIDRGHITTPDITIVDDEGTEHYPDSSEWSTDSGQVLLHWKLDDQPAWEKIVFPDASYRDLYDISTGLGGDVKDWNVATICVPEPISLSLLAMGTMVLLRRRRR